MVHIDPIRRLDDQAIIRYSNKFTLPLPEPFIEANQLGPKDEMEVYRERVNGRDALIIIPKKTANAKNNFENETYESKPYG